MDSINDAQRLTDNTKDDSMGVVSSSDNRAKMLEWLIGNNELPEGKVICPCCEAVVDNTLANCPECYIVFHRIDGLIASGKRIEELIDQSSKMMKEAKSNHRFIIVRDQVPRYWSWNDKEWVVNPYVFVVPNESEEIALKDLAEYCVRFSPEGKVEKFTGDAVVTPPLPLSITSLWTDENRALSLPHSTEVMREFSSKEVEAAFLDFVKKTSLPVITGSDL